MPASGIRQPADKSLSRLRRISESSFHGLGIKQRGAQSQGFFIVLAQGIRKLMDDSRGLRPIAACFLVAIQALVDISREGIHPPGRQREFRVFGIDDGERARQMRQRFLPGMLRHGDLREQPMAECEIGPFARRAGQFEQLVRFGARSRSLFLRQPVFADSVEEHHAKTPMDQNARFHSGGDFGEAARGLVILPQPQVCPSEQDRSENDGMGITEPRLRSFAQCQSALKVQGLQVQPRRQQLEQGLDERTGVLLGGAQTFRQELSQFAPLA